MQLEQCDYKRMFEQVPAMIVSVDTEMVIHAASDVFVEVTGVERQHMLGKKLFSILPEFMKANQRAEFIQASFNRLLQTRLPDELNVIKVQVPRPGGGTMLQHWRTTLFPILNDDGGIAYITIRTTNVTETEQLIARYENEKKALEESERRFRVMMDTIPIKINTSNANGNTFFFNKQWRTETDMGYEELGGWGWKNLIHPDDLHETMQNWRFSLATHTVFDMHRRIRMKDGSYRWNLSRSVPVMDKDDKVMMWITSNTDIHEQKEQEQALESAVFERTMHLEKALAELKQSEEKFNTMFHFAPYCLTLSEVPSGKFVNVNETFLRTFGLSRDEAVGRNSTELGILDDEVRNPLIEKVMNSYELISAEVTWKTKTRGPALFMLLVQTIKIGTEKYFINAMIDITERKKTEEALKAKNKELESFAYISSHDMQEPLRKMQMLAGRILEKENLNLSGKGKNYLRLLEQEASRMQTLIKDLLTFSKVNIEEMIFEPTDLGHIVADVRADLSELITEKNAQVVTAHTCDVHVVRFQFHQLMYNLVNNALKFSRPGVQPMVVISCHGVQKAGKEHPKLLPAKEYCRITVEDNGIGFEAEYSQQIFEVFKRLHSKDEYPGTGIGLAIVKKIIDSHFGSIIAKSTPGKGTMVEIYIPTR